MSESEFVSIPELRNLVKEAFGENSDADPSISLSAFRMVGETNFKDITEIYRMSIVIINRILPMMPEQFLTNHESALALVSSLNSVINLKKSSISPDNSAAVAIIFTRISMHSNTFESKTG